jgi:hypothetical protein
VSEWSCREGAGGIPESAREPFLIYPAGRVNTRPLTRTSPWEGVELVWSEGRAKGARSSHDLKTLSGAAVQRDRLAHGETVAASHPSADTVCASAESNPAHGSGSGCLNCHGRGAVPLVTPGRGDKRSEQPARAHVQEVQHAGLSREACCVISKYMLKLL